MNPLWENILASKERRRKMLAALPIEEKLEIMEKLRDQSKWLRDEREKRERDRAASAHLHSSNLIILEMLEVDRHKCQVSVQYLSVLPPSPPNTK